MYIPSVFAQHDGEALRGLMTARPFALLVTVGGEGPIATHLPLLLDGDVLLGHVAAANPQAAHLAAGTPALAIFSGPHAYVSPSFYATDGQVPTWNYTAVHAHGTPRVLDDAGARAVLDRLVAHFEHGLPAPWRLDDLDPRKAATLIGEIVAFELPIARLEGKWKVGQNRKDVDRLRAAEHLAASSDPDANAVAALMRAAK